MNTKKLMPYGFWPSVLTPERMVELTKVFDVQWDQRGQDVVIFEKREGQSRLLRINPNYGFPRDLISTNPVVVRVNYGGGEYTVGSDAVFFVSRGRIYRKPLDDGLAEAVTKGNFQPASPTLSPNEEWLCFVYNNKEEDGLAVVPAQPGPHKPVVLLTGYDFFMQPTWHPTGQQLAVIAWNHPSMPWDSPYLLLLDVSTDSQGLRVTQVTVLQGPDQGILFQPEFSPDGRYLAYVGEVDDLTQLFVYDLQTHQTRQLTHQNGELAMPAWRQGVRTIGWHHDSQHIYYIVNVEGKMNVWRTDILGQNQVCLTADLPFDVYRQIAVSPKDNQIAMRAVSTTQPERIIVLHDDIDTPWHVIRYTTSNEIPQCYYSRAQRLRWGHQPDVRYGLYYPPTHPQYEDQGPPPMVVLLHGGPTGQAFMMFCAQAQFLATRGFAVLLVNHRGSTGYGKAYRESLRHQWGIYDVEDSISGVEYCIQEGLARRDAIYIMGASAGGLTVYNALIHYPGVFRAGITLYGVANLWTFSNETHKFERHYQDFLIGPLPEATDAYNDRSPVLHADKIQDPVAIFQGSQDPVVPLSQTMEMIAALKSHHVPVFYRVFEGEGHGWHSPKTVAQFYHDLEDFLHDSLKSPTD
ncbi:S9 family peptidase [Sulfobacillus thermosulfidooxidans]|uniref:S9 family peptidase n=1 Tax=Sulfobacillus thermosulfidooxidans TaxID=28034 RepID=UPI00096B84B9|nr:alpha/beta fold hydrolase [Sulfobacillus thermosulfidooxidans]OLZ08768.1 hypothetical protein BFX05_15245 [Sulfobacillus thermosulfidooxidans]OLZ14812.1 hypothetical protein BFX06_05790 [Sulfobacillus thermosulfidooxidans]OLZ22044.1 hypothetical protein BFX07_10580 [Sulfobacillus thermosulfidooxidans]